MRNHINVFRYHEQDPQELIDSVRECIEKATADFVKQGHKVSDISCIGITNQRETVILWDQDTGEPLYNAIAWPDTRTTALVRDLKTREGADGLQDICGLPLSTYPSSVKLLWLMDNVDAVRKTYDEGKLVFGTVDTWLIWNLTGGKEGGHFVTDVTNASRTMFMNLAERKYDKKLLLFFDLDPKKIHLPEIIPSADQEAYGTIFSGVLKGIRITGCLGDQSSALVGQQGFTPGSAKNTYGTGCFLLYNVGEKPVISKHGLLATIAYQFGRDLPAVYALEGSIAVAGSGVKFLVNNLGISSDSQEVSEMAASVPDSGGCVFVTAFSGLFAPYWIDDAQGTIFGITGHVSSRNYCYFDQQITNEHYIRPRKVISHELLSKRPAFRQKQY
jgi:glycerol kinase